MTLLNTEIDERALAKAALDNAEENLRRLCASQAPTFVAVERRGALLTSALHTLLNSIDDATPNVNDVKQSLLEQSNASKKKNEETKDDVVDIMKDDGKCNNLSTLAERHRIRRRTLLQHSALLELLELPSLMDACVRSNLYEDALSVATFANSLERRHLQDGKEKHTVVSNVVSEVRMRENDLRRHLLQRLRSEMTMPECLEVVTALRRLNGVELERKNNASVNIDLESLHAAMELSLIVDFFEARDLWLDSPSTSTSAPSSNSGPLSSIALGAQGSAKTAQSEQLLDMIERYRTRCFEIATQFLAIFHTSSSSTPTLGNGNNTTSLSLLSLWTTRRIQMFLKSLTNHLSRINDCAILRDALDATVFFSTSMGRIGADFQALLPPIFEPQLLHIVTINNWEENGIVTLEKTLNICRDAGVASPLYTPNSNVDKDEDDGTTQSKDSTPLPPRILLSYPPLARLVNAYLTGLNELRRCLLPGIFQPLQEVKLPSFISKVKKILQVHERAVLTPGLKGEATKLRQIANDMRNVFDEVVQPYLEMSLLVALGLYVEPPPTPPVVEEEVVVEEKEEGNNASEEVVEGDMEAVNNDEEDTEVKDEDSEPPKEEQKESKDEEVMQKED